MLLAALSGFLLGGSLIIAIGAQNAYILRMGLLRHHVFWLCLFCAVSDAVLIAIGVAGLGALVTAQPGLLTAVTLGGALFLTFYALVAARRALKPGILKPDETGRPPLGAALAACAAFTWLNPHVYLDTVVLVGSFAARYEADARMAYAIGAMTASFVWFFALGYGARLLAPLFARPAAWRVLDTAIALIMAMLASKLYASLF